MHSGMSGHAITAAVRSGQLIRIRRDRYARPGVDDNTAVAARVGGPLACRSALGHLGIFALDDLGPHIHLPGNHSRARSPRNRRERLTRHNRDGVVTHWHPLVTTGGSLDCVDIIDALRQALRCQPAPLAVASVDNALFLSAIGPPDLDAIFGGLPRELRALRSRVDGRSESGQESVLRWWLAEAGISFRVQVRFTGLGRVDFLIENRIVVEADSRMAHAKWDEQVRDRDRDLELARRGFVTLRPHYAAIMFAPETVIEAITTLLGHLR